MMQGELLGVSVGQILRSIAVEMRKRRRANAEQALIDLMPYGKVHFCHARRNKRRDGSSCSAVGSIPILLQSQTCKWRM